VKLEFFARAVHFVFIGGLGKNLPKVIIMDGSNCVFPSLGKRVHVGGCAFGEVEFSISVNSRLSRMWQEKFVAHVDATLAMANWTV